MDNPLKEIVVAITACAGAANADAQVDAFNHYFTADASFLHPLCYVPPRPDSLQRVIGIYLFYRIVIPLTSFEIQSTAFDERNGKLYVDLIQRPYVRLLSWALGGWRPDIPMHIHFWLRKEQIREEKWLIYKQEDTVQPLNLMVAIPILAPFGYLFYYMCEVVGLLNAAIFTWLGIWQPTRHIRKHPHKAS